MVSILWGIVFIFGNDSLSWGLNNGVSGFVIEDEFGFVIVVCIYGSSFKGMVYCLYWNVVFEVW